jgi:putative addiction module component (TIGR02574 family)
LEGGVSATLDELTAQSLALPIGERAALAQRLWASLDRSDEVCDSNSEGELLETLKRRSFDMDRGTVAGLPHSEVMAAARKAVDACLLESRS